MRTSIEALAAVFGGTQSLHTNSFDEAIALPTDFSARIARNTQIIIQEENPSRQRSRPMGGLVSYGKTDHRTGRRGLGADSRKSKRLGGMAKAIEDGLPKLRIEEVRRPQSRRASIRGEDNIVGVNKYRLTDKVPFATRE